MILAITKTYGRSEMGDSKETYKLMTERGKNTKQDNFQRNMNFLNECGINRTELTQYHLRLHTFAGDIDFWPSTNKWAFKGSSKTHYGDAKMLFSWINMNCSKDIDDK